MRTQLAGPITPLLGSLGLHGCALLSLMLAVRRPPQLTQVSTTRAEAWAGSALEVDAIATPDGVPTVPNNESPEPALPSARAPEPPAGPAPALAAAPAFAPTAEGTAPVTPAPRTRIHKPPRHVQADAAQSSTPANAVEGTGKPNTVAATGAFGSDALPPGVLRLPSAFTRAIPPATGADPIWQTLPAGTQRPFTVAVVLDADGHIQGSKILEDHSGNPAPEQFVHLRERVIALLGAGLFALQDHVASGSGVFRITITLSDRAVDNEAEPAQLVERGFDPPRGAQAGRAYFTLASGRHFVAKVEVLNAQHGH
ncbi:MAG: hypothetical protein ABJB12_00535 [Pseudomonadota bacterium]